MGTSSEPEFRMSGWGDLSGIGRAAYVQTMASSYLRHRGEQIPVALVSGRLVALRSWLEEDRLEGLGEHHSSDDTWYVQPERVPMQARLSAEDLTIIDAGLAAQWETLGPAKQHVFLLRMAVAYVATEYGGMVPAGLIQRAIDAARALGNN